MNSNAQAFGHSNTRTLEHSNVISRRSFLGGLVAASALPALAGDDLSLFPSRGRFERMVLAYQHVNIGLAKPFSILHISDSHLTEAYDREAHLVEFAAARRKTFGGRQQEALADSLAWAKTNVDYVLHTGDFSDFVSDANFDLVRKLYGDAAMFGCTGNHEYQRRLKGEPIRNTDEYNALSRAKLSAAYPFDVKFQSNVVNGVNFVCIEQTYGFVTPDQVERFRAEAKKGLPIVLCMHVPFFTDHIWRAHEKFWSHNGHKFAAAVTPKVTGDFERQLSDKTTCDFVSYLRKEPLLKAILAGHLHITVQDRFSPTAVQYVVGGNFMFHGQEVFFT